MGIRMGGGGNHGGTWGILIGTIVALGLCFAAIYFNSGGMDKPIVKPTPTPTVCVAAKTQSGATALICGPQQR